MPRIVRCALFSKRETEVLRRANRFTDIAFPLASDSLVQRSTEALARAVTDDDQRRRALGALVHPFTPITYPQVMAARRFLDVLLDQMVKESEVEHWLGLSATPEHPQSQQMAQVLAAERTGQQRIVREAIEVVEAALSAMGAADDPRPAERRTDYGGFISAG